MNNSVNYGNFIALFIKSNNDEFYDITTNTGNYTHSGNKPHLDKKQDPEQITGFKRWLGE